VRTPSRGNPREGTRLGDSGMQCDSQRKNTERRNSSGGKTGRRAEVRRLRTEAIKPKRPAAPTRTGGKERYQNQRQEQRTWRLYGGAISDGARYTHREGRAGLSEARGTRKRGAEIDMRETCRPEKKKRRGEKTNGEKKKNESQNTQMA